MDEYLLHAVLAGVGVAVISGPLGCFVVWRRMAFFGDTIAHGALLGIALGLMLEIGPSLGGGLACLLLSALLLTAQRWRHLASDTVLAILSHGSLAVGLVALSSLGQGNMTATLMGDILSVGKNDLVWIWGGGLVILGGLVLIWRPLLAVTVHEELAQVEGVPTERAKLAFMLLLALTVALALKVVGVLLITALLIIPAATARRFAISPESMALGAALVGVLAVGLGLSGSLFFDLPAGPAIVVGALVLFALSLPRWLFWRR